MSKKWVEFLYANAPREVDAEQVLFSRRVGMNWTMRQAKLEQLRRIVSHVGNDPTAFVKRCRKDKSTLLTGKLYEVVTGCKDYLEEDLARFWNFAFGAGELDHPEIATAFLEGILEAWKDVMSAEEPDSPVEDAKAGQAV